jgi:choice-of-anchor A domain-containing protein
MRRVGAWALAVATLAGLSVGGTTAPRAHAAQTSDSCAATGIPGEFDVFVAGRYTATSGGTQIQGRAAAGGDVTIQGVNVGTALTPDAGRLDLLVGGDLSVLQGGAGVHNGTVSYGGTLTRAGAIGTLGISQAAPPFAFDDQFGALREQSAQWADLEPNGQVTGPTFGALELTGADPNLNVFEVTAALLQSAQQVRINVPAGSTTLVNVSGSTYANTLTNVQLSNSSAGRLIWNFPGATSVQIGGLAWQGAVLAPNAAVSVSNGQVNGPIVAAQLSSSSIAINHAPFGGCLPPPGSGYSVTFVALSCPAYSDIFANLARNNIVESLKDLGPDTQYVGGELVNPTAEGIPPQSNCTPLPGWEFTLGHGYQSRAVTGPWGSLSKVTDPFPRAPIVTETQTPLLNQDGLSVDDQQLAGATTIELTPQERAQASSPDQLWAQGGTATDPVLAQKFPGPEYAFGTLRCAVDNLNGDNVEYIFFPAGVRHVFCYGLYVKPPPTSGTITIEKHVSGAPPGGAPLFSFNGSISFDPDGFQLAASGSQDFFRAGGSTWTVTESATPNYQLKDLSCSAQAPGGGPGSSAVDVSRATAAIHLVGGEHVTCVYTDRYVPPPGGLTILKVSRGGVGQFAYTVTPVSGHGAVHHAHAATTEPDVVVDAQPSPLSLSPGRYRIRERAPDSSAGRWHRRSVDCNGATRSAARPVEVKVASGQAVACTFVNAFVPRGSISISKITEGATGTATFLVTPMRGAPAQYLQTVTTTATGVAAIAVPHTAADAIDRLRLGSYRIVEQLPASSPAGAWTLMAVDCNGTLEPFAQGTANVTLTTAHPHAHCLYIDTFSATPPPPPPEPQNPPPVVSPPNPPPPEVGPEPIFPDIPDRPEYHLSDLVVTKHPSAPIVTRGDVVGYQITIKNRGPDPAQRVVLGDKELGAAIVLKAHTSAGPCHLRPDITCQLGTIDRGQTVTVTVRVRVETRASTLTDIAVAGTATQDQTFAHNVARATIRVITPPPPLPPAPPAGLG